MGEMDENSSVREFKALQAVIGALQPLDADTRERIFDTAATFFEIGRARGRATASGPISPSAAEPARPQYPSFSEDTTLSPKEFLFQKQPRTDVERIAVLA